MAVADADEWAGEGGIMMDDELKNAGKATLVDVSIDALLSTGADIIKKEGLSMLSETLLNAGVSIIPAVGTAITNYRTNKAIRNIEIQVEQLKEHGEALQRNLNIMSVEVKQKLDDIFLHILEKTVLEKQEEKIAYFTNSFLNLSSYQKIDTDISYIYLDILSQLTYLDIQVLLDMKKGPSYYYLNPDEQATLDITMEQYQAIKSNLNRLALVDNVFDKVLSDDLKATNEVLAEYREAIIELQTLQSKPKTKIHPLKNRSKTKPAKIKAKDKMVISKLGKDFIDFIVYDLGE